MFNFLVSVIISFNIVVILFSNRVTEFLDSSDLLKIDFENMNNEEKSKVNNYLLKSILVGFIFLSERILELIMLAISFYRYDLSIMLILTFSGYILINNFVDSRIIKLLLLITKVVCWIMVLFNI